TWRCWGFHYGRSATLGRRASESRFSLSPKWSTIMSAEHFENLIIGSGVAGKLLSWTLAGRGQKTVVVERAMVGGSCPNVACLPSKNVIQSAKAVALVHPTRGLGVVTGSVRVDMAAVARRKWKMVNGLVEVHLGKFKASGAELVMGEARFTGPKK